MKELQQKILALKNDKNALILAHYYQAREIQEVADHVCDSFEMAQRALKAEEETLVICGVRFMAETAKILNPGKTVLLPVPGAGCPMADMIAPGDVMRLRERYPGAAVVCYVNSSAAVKAACDVCCTSSSAEKIVSSLQEQQIIFVPDRNLGAYVASKVPEKEIILFDGCCPIHDSVTENDVLAAKLAHPEAALLVHPECRAEVLSSADYIGSTAGIIKEAFTSSSREFIIGTESEVAARLSALAPEKRFYPLMGGFECADMKKIALSDILISLERNEYEVLVGVDDIIPARNSLERMIALG